MSRRLFSAEFKRLAKFIRLRNNSAKKYNFGWFCGLGQMLKGMKDWLRGACDHNNLLVLALSLELIRLAA